MKLNTKIRYEEEYLPTKRHRIPRIREVEETIEVELKGIKKDEAKLAFVVSDYGSFLDGNGESQFGPVKTEIFAVDNTLYTQKKDMWGVLDKGPLSMTDFIREIERHGDCYYCWSGKSKEDVLRSLHKFVDSHMLVDGAIYEQTNEPRYVINTFGLGHNHGGTAMSIAHGYNPNIKKENYFNALQRDEAIAYANKVATGRGDTNNVGKFGEGENIEVFMPEMVKCNPQIEHGDGNSFLNLLESMTSGSDSTMEAGFLVMTATAAELKNENLSLDSKIANAKSDIKKPNDKVSKMER